MRGAHGEDIPSAESARKVLLERYGTAIQRYLLGAVRNASVADDLFQEFAVKLLKGDFKRANPELGKFRSYVKTTLFHMVAHYRRSQAKRKEVNIDVMPESGEESEADFGDDENFLQAWREAVLARAWQQLELAEKDGGPKNHTLLKIRVENPAAGSEELAKLLSDALNKEVKAGNSRVLIHRARIQFAHALFQTISDSMDNPIRESVEAELIDIRLIEYCRDAFESFSFKK